MKKIWVISFVIVSAGLTVWLGAGTKSAGQVLPNCPGKAFSRQVMVFEVVAICATADVPNEKLIHAANVTAEWLDNDGDGLADEPRLINALNASAPFLIMTAESPGRRLMAAVESAMGTRIGQDLSASETNPKSDRRDASQEEIHHLIHNAGWKVAFPDIFADQEGTSLYGQWEKAEKQGHYSYDDPTCDANCKVVEFFYLATAAYLGSTADLASDEMRLKNRTALLEALPDLVVIMESDLYRYPLDHWPSGSYDHQQNLVASP